MPDSLLSHRRIQRALQRLAELAAAEQLALEVALCHGHIITVVYALAQDPNAHGGGYGKLVASSSRAAALVRQIAVEQRLPASWLEDDVKFFLALTAARNQSHLHQFGPNLILSVSEPAHLFAMKLHAFHVEPSPAVADRHDLAFLMQKMGIASMEAVEHAYVRFFPDHSLAEDVRRLVERLLPARV